jgi:S-ribosylhomocysteine lyase
MAQVESFLLDHTKVKAPYVRLAGSEDHNGAHVSKFDLRFLQPNHGEMPTGALHTTEHLLATWMRDELEGIIDISPMGCRTGSYMIMWEDVPVEKVRDALKTVLGKIAEASWEQVPAVSEKECGNYKDHSLWGAREYAKLVLAQGISSDPFERKL